jgi:hypothetical protein
MFHSSTCKKTATDGREVSSEMMSERQRLFEFSR